MFCDKYNPTKLIQYFNTSILYHGGHRTHNLDTSKLKIKLNFTKLKNRLGYQDRIRRLQISWNFPCRVKYLQAGVNWKRLEFFTFNHPWYFQTEFKGFTGKKSEVLFWVISLPGKTGELQFPGWGKICFICAA